jgi:predicted Zn-dependent protease
MKSFRTGAALAIALLIASVAFAQSNGSGRMAGKVVDEQGKPVDKVKILAQKVGEQEIKNTQTNGKGDWVIGGIASGEWKLEFSKDGMVHRMVQKVSEADRDSTANMKITLTKAAPPPPDPNVEINAEWQKAVGMIQAGKYPEARAVCEALVAKFPEVYQIHRCIATTYTAEKNAPKALEHAKLALAGDPNNVDAKLLVAEILLDTGAKAEARAMLDSVDITQVKDPFPFVNYSITLINEGKGLEAVEMLNKLVAQFPDQHLMLYYRARAYLSAQKLDESKADFEKFVAVAPPDSKEVADAKKILEQMVKK